MPLNVAAIKKDFPILGRSMRNNSNLIYLDSGATSQKPFSVVKTEENFYFKHNAAVHRGSHLLAEEANEEYENARKIIAEFIGAPSQEVIFTKSATESLNLLALTSNFTSSNPIEQALDTKFSASVGIRDSLCHQYIMVQ